MIRNIHLFTVSHWSVGACLRITDLLMNFTRQLSFYIYPFKIKPASYPKLFLFHSLHKVTVTMLRFQFTLHHAGHNLGGPLLLFWGLHSDLNQQPTHKTSFMTGYFLHLTLQLLIKWLEIYVNWIFERHTVEFNSNELTAFQISFLCIHILWMLAVLF